VGWTPVTNNFDWSRASVVQEYFLAYRERWYACGGPLDWYGNPALPNVPAVGDDVQGAGLWAYVQQYLEAMAPQFVNHQVSSGSLEGLTAATMWTLGAWRAAAGLASGFRRATTMPADWTNYSDPAFSYGYMQEGDIIGPWILADLQAGLNLLLWTQPLDPDGGNWGWSFGDLNFNEGHGSGSTAAAARAAAEADFDGGTNRADSCAWPLGSEHAFPRAETGWGGGPTYNAWMIREYEYGFFGTSFPGSTPACNVDWYVYADFDIYPYADWNSNGDWPAGYAMQTLHKWLSDSGLTGISNPSGPGLLFKSSAHFGSAAKPAWGALPAHYYGYGDPYIISGAVRFYAVAKWNVPGGFAHVP